MFEENEINNKIKTMNIWAVFLMRYGGGEIH